MTYTPARYVLTTAAWATLIVSAWLSVFVSVSPLTAPWRWAAYGLLIAASLVTALVSRRSAWTQISVAAERDARADNAERALRRTKADTLRELAEDARVRGDVGKEGGVEAWDYLNLYADKIERGDQ